MAERRIRVYADASVYGGAYDKKFQIDSQRFFQQVRQGRFLLTISAVVRREIITAPDEVRFLYEQMLPFSEPADVTEDAVALANAYVSAGILTPKSADDALHVAIATVFGCPVIVSWNFRHIVHFQKIPLYNAVNAVNGYRAIEIRSPSEVIKYEDKDN